MDTISNFNFKEIAEKVIEASPEEWRKHVAYLSLVQRDVNYHLEQKFTIKQKVKFLQKKLEDCYVQLNSLEIKYGILPFLNGETPMLIEGVVAMLDRAIIQHPTDNDDLKEIRKLHSEDMMEFVKMTMDGEMNIDKAFEIKQKIESYSNFNINVFPELKSMFELLKMSEEQRLALAFDKIMSIYSIHNQIEWLRSLINKTMGVEQQQGELNGRLYNEILEPIETDGDPKIFVKALDFFCNTKNTKGEFFLSKVDVERLKEIGHRLPKDGTQVPMTFKLNISRNDKEMFYGFFYIAWSKFFPRNRGKNYYALYIKTYFEDFKDFGVESIQSAIKTPSLDKKTKIESFF